MTKYKIDYHAKSGRYFIKYKGHICSHKVLGDLVREVRKEFGHGTYSMTRAARKAHS
jgi:hypothetical protein